MSKELRELLNRINEKKVAAKAAYKSGNIEEGDKLKDEAVSLQAQANGLIALDGLGDEGEPVPQPKPKSRSSLDIIKAFIKGDRSSEDVVKNISTVDDPENPNNVSLIIPQDIQTQIREERKQYKSARNIVGYVQTATLSGSYPVEDSSTMTDLDDYTDDQELTESEGPKFKQVSYKIHFKGSWLPISNILRHVADSSFIPFVSKWWNKKVINTENKEIFAALKKDKVAVPIDGLKGLKHAINVDLDPAYTDIILVTNQDGYDYLDNLTDANGKPLLNPDPMQRDRMLFKGQYPISYFSNRQLASTGTKAPIFIGDLKSGVDFIELDSGLQMATSEHAEFKKNRTLMRVVAGYDVQQTDSDAYIFGEIETASETAGA